MATVAKLFVLSGVVILALSADGFGPVLGYLLIGAGFLIPIEEKADPTAARIEELDRYVRRLHQWIVEREKARAAEPFAAAAAPAAEPAASPVPEPVVEVVKAVTPSTQDEAVSPAATEVAAFVAAAPELASPLVAEEEVGSPETERPVADEVAEPQVAVSPSDESLVARDRDREEIEGATAEDANETQPEEPLSFPIPEAAEEEPAAAFEPAAARVTATAPVMAAAARVAQAPPRPQRSLLDFEQILGTNWLAKVGVAILVIGVSFFLAWQLREMGPIGKVGVGITVGLGMLGAGIWFERNERYRILARAGIAGGWALLFFVSYAAHHVSAARIIESPVTALVLMLLIAAAMVGHTLRYRSQAVTSLAFLLAFATVSLNRADLVGLTANVALAIAFSVVVVRMRWFRLEIAGILAAYLNHYLWLRPLIVPTEGELASAASFGTSAAILLLYWAIFRISFVVRRAPDERTSVLAGLLNSGLLLMVLRAQPATPGATFWLLVVLGVIEIALARLPVMRERRDSFIALTTLGVAFITTSIPLRFAPSSVTAAWLVNAIALVAVGVATRERVYRRLGSIVGSLTAAHLLFFPLGRAMVGRLEGSGAGGANVALGVLALAVAAALLVESFFVVRRWPELYPHKGDRAWGRVIGYAATAVIFAAGWIVVPANATGVFWAAIALLLALVNRRLRTADMAVQATLLACIAFLRTMTANLGIDDAPLLALGGRLVTVTAAALLLYAFARAQTDGNTPGHTLGRIGGLWSGTALLILLAWFEVPQLQLALAWTAFAFVLALLARRFDSLHLAAQANGLAALTVLLVLAVNFPEAATANAALHLSWRTLTTLAVVALLYVLMRWNGARPLDAVGAGRAVPSWTAAALLTLLIQYELRQAAVVLGWTVLAFLLAAVGRRWHDGHFAAQANVIAIVGVTWMFAVGMESGAPVIDAPLPLTWRALSTLALAGLLYTLSRWNAPWEELVHSVGRIAPRLFANALLFALLWRELQVPAVVVGWSALGLVLAYAGRRFRLADLTMQANAIAAAAAIRILTVNLPSNAAAFTDPWPLSWRVIGTSLVVTLLYLLARWNGGAWTEERRADTTLRNLAAEVPLWGGTALLTLLAWYELRPASVAIAWALFAIVLLEAGLHFASRKLVVQAMALLLLTCGRVFVVNMNIDDFGAIGARVFTVVPIVGAFLWAWWRTEDQPREGGLVPRWFPPLLAWLAIACLAALVRFQLAADAVIVGWAAMAALLLAVAHLARRRVFVPIALALSVATLARGSMHNLYVRSYFPSPGSLDRWMWIGAAAALLLAALPFAFRLRILEGHGERRFWLRALRAIERRPEQTLFFSALLLLTALIGVEMRSGMLTMAWGLEAVAVFVFALLVGERTFRLSGVALLLLCVGKIFALDFWALTLRDKALTGIVMGLALIGVSLLYSRKRETILKYL